MKKSFVFFMLLFCIKGFSQFTLDFQSQIFQLRDLKLSNSLTKYLDYGQLTANPDQFTIYNLDGTFYKTVTLPAPPSGYVFHYEITNISVSLFDNNPSTIEYLVWYANDSIAGSQSNLVRVIREDGTILFSENNASYPNTYSTEEGAKLMLLYHYANGQFIANKVFSLPGELPTSINDKLDGSNSSSIYPNPNGGSFYLKYKTNPVGGSNLQLFSNTGSLIGTFNSNDNPIHINVPGLSDGIYFLNNVSNGGITRYKVFIKK